MQVATDVDAVGDRSPEAREGPLGVLPALAVVGGGDAVLGDQDRYRDPAGGVPHGALEGLRVELPTGLGAAGRRVGRHRSVWADHHPGVGLYADEVVGAGG